MPRVSFVDTPEINGLCGLASMELPNPYQAVCRNSRGETIDFPWDFVRHYCDESYRSRVEAIGATGRETLGSRIRHLSEAARMTQEELATAAGIGRVTLVRIENGAQSPRYETLVALAGAIGRPVAELLEGGG